MRKTITSNNYNGVKLLVSLVNGTYYEMLIDIENSFFKSYSIKQMKFFLPSYPYFNNNNNNNLIPYCEQMIPIFYNNTSNYCYIGYNKSYGIQIMPKIIISI